MRILPTLIFLLAISAAAHADDCKAIQDPAARLACFDRPGKPAVAKAKKPAVDEFAEAKDIVRKKLSDPESARFDDLFKVQGDHGETVCGMVNSKNKMGGYVGATGFIFEKNIQSATIMMSGDSDPNYTANKAATYCLYCMPAGRGDRTMVEFCPGLLQRYRG